MMVKVLTTRRECGGFDSDDSDDGEGFGLEGEGFGREGEGC